MTDTELLLEQVAEETANMSLTEVFQYLDESGYDDLYRRLTDVFCDVVDVITEERQTA